MESIVFVARFMEDAKKMALAYEIADALSDRKSIDVHIAFAYKYSEEHIRNTLKYVLSRRDEEITSSRAAYYVYLIRKNGKRSWN